MEYFILFTIGIIGGMLHRVLRRLDVIEEVQGEHVRSTSMILDALLNLAEDLQKRSITIIGSSGEGDGDDTD